MQTWPVYTVPVHTWQARLLPAPRLSLLCSSLVVWICLEHLVWPAGKIVLFI